MTKTETCYRCDGNGGEQLSDGFMPCFRCGTSGRLPAGTKANWVRWACPECGGAGGSNMDLGDGPGWFNCRACGGTGEAKKRD